MDQLGSYLGQGLEHEAALVHAGMGKLEGWRVEDHVAVEEHIEVEGARAVGNAVGAVAAEAVLNGQQSFEEGLGLEAGFEGDGGVEKLRLIGVADGLGGVVGRSRDDAAYFG